VASSAADRKHLAGRDLPALARGIKQQGSLFIHIDETAVQRGGA
jgi:hypothetical protein